MFQNPILDLLALGCHRRLKSIVSRLRGDPDEDRQKATSSCFSHKSTHTGLCMDMGPYRDSTGSCRDSTMGSLLINHIGLHAGSSRENGSYHMVSGLESGDLVRGRSQ